MAFRNRALIKGFENLGYKVDVLTTVPYSESIRVKELGFLDNIKIIRLNNGTNLGAFKKGSNSWMASILRFFFNRTIIYDSSYFLLYNISLNLLPDNHYDYVVSSSDPKTSHLFVSKLKKLGLSYNYWIQYWGDPLAEDISSKLIYPKVILRYFERKIINKADKVVYVSPLTCKEQMTKFSDIKSKMTYVPIPYFSKKYYPQTNNKAFQISYVGFYLSHVRNILPLYECVNSMSKDVQLNIVGESDIVLKSTSNVHIYPSTNDPEKIELFTDLLVVLLNKKGGQIPGKIYHLAATNKPVLVIIDGDYENEIHDYLNKFGRFILCRNNLREIRKAINEYRVCRKEFMPCESFECTAIANELLHVI